MSYRSITTHVNEITEIAEIVLHIPLAIRRVDEHLIKDIVLKDFEHIPMFNIYYLKKKEDSSNSLKDSLLRLHSYLLEKDIPHRLTVLTPPHSNDQIVKLSYFFWFDSDGVKRHFKYEPYIPSERDFLTDEYSRKISNAGGLAINYVNALSEYKAYSSDSMPMTNKPNQETLRHLYLSKRLLST